MPDLTDVLSRAFTALKSFFFKFFSGGAAEKAGLQCGDMIIKVNGVNVTQSTHTHVVSLIRGKSGKKKFAG